MSKRPRSLLVQRFDTFNPGLDYLVLKSLELVGVLYLLYGNVNATSVAMRWPPKLLNELLMRHSPLWVEKTAP